MKTIVIPTDFSPLADSAVQYGAQLAQAIQADMVLLSVYMVPVAINEAAVTVLSAEELKNNADEGLQRIQQQLQHSFPDIPVRTESRLGDVVDELHNICKEVNAFAVVMGVHHLSDMEQLLFGSSTLSAIRHIPYPIIAVAADTIFRWPQRMVLATDLVNLDKFPAEKITELAETFKARLHMVHVTDKDASVEENAVAPLAAQLPTLQPVCDVIKDEDIAHGLQQYVQQQQADWLLLIPHERSFFQRLFSKTHIKNILDHISIPVVSVGER